MCGYVCGSAVWIVHAYFHHAEHQEFGVFGDSVNAVPIQHTWGEPED